MSYVFVLQRFTANRSNFTYQLGTQPVKTEDLGYISSWVDDGRVRAATDGEISTYENLHPVVVSTSSKLLSSTLIDFNEGTLAKQLLYSVPDLRRINISQMTIDKLSNIPVSVQFTVGWNNSANDILDTFILSDLVNSLDTCTSLLTQPKSLLSGLSGQTLGIIIVNPEGSALQGRFNVFGSSTDVNGLPVNN